MWSLVVPVLPATSHPGSRARAPVPFSTTSRSISVTSHAAAGSTVRFGARSGRQTTLPSASSMRSMGELGMRVPWFARVP